MKIEFDFISDIHLDFYISENQQHNKLLKSVNTFINKILPEYISDILIIAGDLGHYNNQNYYFLNELAKIYKHVLIVFGNHDYYLVSRNQYSKYSNSSLNRMNDMINRIYSIKNVHILRGDIFEYEGIKYSGTNMWYDGKLSNQIALLSVDDIQKLWTNYMNDGNYISELKKYDGFFDNELTRLEKNIYNVDVYFSHVGPVLPPNIPIKYDNTYIRFFYFDGYKYLKNNNSIKVWVFGHTHEQYNFTKENTEFICNPLGYPMENLNRKIRNYNNQ